MSGWHQYNVSLDLFCCYLSEESGSQWQSTGLAPTHT